MSSFVYMNYYVTPIKPGDVFLLKTTCGHPPPPLDFSLDEKSDDSLRSIEIYHLDYSPVLKKNHHTAEVSFADYSP